MVEDVDGWKLLLRRAKYLFAVIVAMPIIVGTLVVGGGGIIYSELTTDWRSARIDIDAYSWHVPGVGLFDIVTDVLKVGGGVLLGLALVGFGCWLVYHMFFGDHNDRWPRRAGSKTGDPVRDRPQ